MTRPEHTLSRKSSGWAFAGLTGTLPLLQREGIIVHITLRRSAVAATVALTLSGLLLNGVASPAQAAATPPHELAGDWLTAQLTGGLIHNTPYNFDDYGLTVDTALGLAAIGGYTTTVGEISDAVANGVNSYTTGADWGNSDVYAGPTAKSLVLAQTAGADPTTYGGVNLVRRLNGMVSTDSVTKGRIEDSSATDYANVIGQAFAVQGLAASGSGKAAPARNYLLKQQCTQGYFRLYFTKKKTASNQTCDGGTPAGSSAPDTDATALAVLSLNSLNSTAPEVKSAIRDATAWLKAHQKANGSFGGGTSTEGSNTNSTGLAGWALGATGSCTAAAKAAHWVGRLQSTTTDPDSKMFDELGAIAYNWPAFNAGTAEGILDPTEDQWRRATAQAAPALSNLSVSDCRAR